MRMSWTWVIVVGFAGVLGPLPGAVRAEDPPPAPKPAPAPGPEAAPTPPTLGVEPEIGALLDAVARQSGAVFVWDPSNKMLRERRVRLSRDLHAEGKLDLPALRRILSMLEQAIVPMGPADRPTYVIVDARQQGTLLRLKTESVVVTDENVAALEAMDGVFVSTALRIDGIPNLRDLRSALQRLVTGQNIGSVAEVPDAGVLIVTDFAPSVAAIYRTIRQVEAARGAGGAAGPEVQTIQLAHAVAADLARLLTQTFAPPPLPPHPTQAPGGALVPTGPRVLADERTNQLVIAGTSAEIRDVLAVVRSLDVPTVPGR